MFEQVRRQQANDKRTDASKKADMSQVKYYLWRWVCASMLITAVVSWLLFLNTFAIFALILAIGSGFMSLRSLVKAAPKMLEAVYAETARGLVRMERKYRNEGARAHREITQYTTFVLERDELPQIHYDYANALLDMVEGSHTGDLEQSLKTYREYMQAMYNLPRDQ